MKKYAVTILVLLLVLLPGIFSLASPEPQRGGSGGDLRTLIQIQARREREIMALPGVLGIGIGPGDTVGQLAFVVLVDKDALMPQIPTRIENVSVKIKRSGKIIASDGGTGCYPCHNDKVSPPVPMGLSTSNNLLCFWCSLGFKACRPSSSTIGYLTNNHCNPNASGCENGAAVGTSTFHRGTGLAGCNVETKIGELFATVPISFSGTNLVDASFVKSSNSLTSRTVFDLGTHTQTPGTVTLGMTVRKSGASSGSTTGTVTGVNLTINVSGYCGGTATFAQQVMYSPNPPYDTMSIGGDSGSGVFDTNMNPVALNFAGNGVDGFGATVQNLLNLLGLTLDLSQCQGGGPPPGGGGCAAQTAVEETPNEADRLTLLYRFRDKVLAQTLRGQQYTRQFYQFSDEAVGIMLSHPDLQLQAQEALERFAPVIQSLVDRGRATVSRADLLEVDQLLTTYATVGSPTLRQTLEQLRRDIRDRRVQTEFGIMVSP
jgi:hypothetical protein